MSFDYKPYAKNLLAILRDPRTWLGIESQRLVILNKAIHSTNQIYNHMLNDVQRKAVDVAVPGCAGQLPEIKNSNDGDKLLFSVFGPFHPMNPVEKNDNLIKCVEKKIEAIINLLGTGAPIAVPTYPSMKEKYLKYKNKYLEFKNNF